MNAIMNFVKSAFNKFCQQGLLDRANFLKNIGVIGWVLSSLAQTSAILFNDKIPSKEKKFLIPQEIFDGLTNATLFWFVTSKATDFGKSLVLKKLVLPKSIIKIMENFVPKKQSLALMQNSFFSHLKQFGDAKALKTGRLAVDGMGVLAGITGAVIANNIITPLVRNKLAGLCQKKEIAKSQKYAPLNPYYGVNLNVTQPSLKNYTAFNHYSPNNLKI